MEEVLEAWGPADALRELIANALDEATLTETADPDIYEDDAGNWHVRDHGRGLQYEHFTQSEDEEKLAHPDEVIGKFGVGLKDAIATFHRHGIDVTIHSSHGTFTVKEAPKHGFEEIETLHVSIESPERDITGTDIILKGIEEDTVKEAKQNFIRYTEAERLVSTRFGDVYSTPPGEHASVYVTGIRVATEPNFLFSYDITNTTKSIRDALNRERSNVGRTAYTSRVKKILQACDSETVAQQLVDDLQRFTSGETHDELGWKDIQVHAVKVLNANQEVVIATTGEQANNRDLLEQARNDGYQVVTIPDRIQSEVQNETDTKGGEIRGMEAYATEYEDSFDFDIIAAAEMTPDEQRIWSLRETLFEIIGCPPEYTVQVSETLRATDDDTTRGVHIRSDRRIILRRDTLSDSETFIGTLLHELAHTRTLAPDQTREFESVLTDFLGVVGNTAINPDSYSNSSS
ncbi:ATP-binding protein [Halolamina sp.]|uniref:ATP-binding protein n=1 Tax=Halolamina sp. TaxID=1940283 RepID=UPI003563FF5B